MSSDSVMVSRVRRLALGAVAGLLAGVLPASVVSAAPSRVFSITTVSVPAAEVATPYAVTLAASGGKTPFSWSVTAGGFPDGVVLAPATGVVSGSPTSVAVGGDVTVTVTDAAGKVASKTFSIAVFPKLVVSTLTLPGAIMGAPYSAPVTAVGGSGGYVWSLGAKSTLPNGLSLSAATGVISGTPTAFGTKSFTMVVRDSAGYSASQALSITVNSDLRITTTSLPVAMASRAYSGSLAAAGGRTPYKWAVAAGSALPAGLSLASSSGTVSGTPTAANMPTPTNVTFTVTDASGVTLRRTLAVSVYANLSVTTASLPVSMVGETYPSTPLAASGGDGTYTWSLLSGSLPTGMTFTGGTLAGSPTASTPGTSLQFRVTDANGFTATRTLSLTVHPTLAVTTSTLPDATIDAAYPATTLAATGGDSSYTWAVTSGNLPDGLSLASTGAITGTPSASATSQTFTVTVSDGRSATATATLTITVNDALAVTTSTLPDTIVGDTYTTSLAATGGDGTYTWTVTSGSLPGGLSLDPDGTISGSPVIAETATFTVTVTDGNNYTATATLTITVYDALTVTTSTLPDTMVGDTYTTSLAATGGDGTYTWAVTTGNLPDGLSLDPDGTISGTVGSTATSQTFTVTVTDGNNYTATATLTITVYDALTVTTSTLPDGQPDSLYAGATLAASGGDGTYTWAVTTGNLPDGLSLDPDGTISGTVGSTATSQTFTVTVTDGRSATATATLTITIVSPAPAGAQSVQDL